MIPVPLGLLLMLPPACTLYAFWTFTSESMGLFFFRLASRASDSRGHDRGRVPCDTRPRLSKNPTSVQALPVRQPAA